MHHRDRQTDQTHTPGFALVVVVLSRRTRCCWGETCFLPRQYLIRSPCGGSGWSRKSHHSLFPQPATRAVWCWGGLDAHTPFWVRALAPSPRRVHIRAPGWWLCRILAESSRFLLPESRAERGESQATNINGLWRVTQTYPSTARGAKSSRGCQPSLLLSSAWRAGVPR